MNVNDIEDVSVDVVKDVGGVVERHDSVGVNAPSDVAGACRVPVMT